MVDNSSISSHNNPEKRNSPFKNMLNNVKNFMKKNGEANKPSSVESSRTEKNQDSNTPNIEAYKKREVKSSKRVMRANKNEQKLPEKFKKGW